MASQVKLEDSNMANYGTDEHKAMRKDAAKKEKAWENAGKEAGIQIWRIEKFQVKPWAKDRYGEFYSGDSYIILHTMINDEGKKTYDVFFWLGGQTTQDEAGSAAYKTVELDDCLGGEPVQYREVQGNETKKFLDCFNKVTILDGGVESGFRNVKPEEYKPRLLHISGYQKHVQVYQVALKVESLNDHDAFVLDGGLKIWQFNGTQASAWEKRKANAIVDELTASRNGKVQKSYIIDGLKDKGSPLIEEFWGHFGGRPNKINDEEDAKEAPKVEVSLHHITDASGVLEIKEIGRGKLDKSKLNSDDAFILDGGSQIFAWIGKNASKNERKEAMAYAVRYLGEQGRAADVPIARVIDGQEPQEFWQVFKGQPCGGRAHQIKEWKK